MVEKTVAVDLSSPFDRDKLVFHNIETANIIKISKGVIFGEEVLTDAKSYEYSIRV